MLKDDSIGRQLDLSFMQTDSGRKLRVKLEIDTRPPAGSGFESHYLDFPLDFEVRSQDLASNFALKIHALLCRDYLKGRDWFDFNWYIKQGVAPNLSHLQAALRQAGPWQGTDPVVDAAWLEAALTEAVNTITWREAADDVDPFLSPAERHGLALWKAPFFLDKVRKLSALIRQNPTAKD